MCRSEEGIEKNNEGSGVLDKYEYVYMSYVGVTYQHIRT